MKSFSVGLAAHVALGQTTLTTVLVILRRDGTEICVTEHDEDLVFTSGIRAAMNAGNLLHSIGHDVTALAYAGFSKFNLEDKSNLDTANIQVQGMIDASLFTRDDILARRFDYADVQVFMVNWNDLTQADGILLTGRTGTWTIEEFGFKTNFYGLAKQLEDVGGEICGPTCRVNFGSPKCAPDGVLADGTTIDSLMQSGEVGATDGKRTLTATGIADIGKPLNGGLITWLTGNNAGLSQEVKVVDTDTGDITLYLAALLTIQVGDTFKLMPGCDHTFNTCVNSYHNGVNFQGEPHAPGQDYELNYPDWHAPHA